MTAAKPPRCRKRRLPTKAVARAHMARLTGPGGVFEGVPADVVRCLRCRGAWHVVAVGET